jgi:hypothetical protein
MEERRTSDPTVAGSSPAVVTFFVEIDWEERKSIPTRNRTEDLRRVEAMS